VMCLTPVPDLTRPPSITGDPATTNFNDEFHEFLSPSGDTMWVQARSTPAGVAGTTVTLNDTAPISWASPSYRR
jgi:hypothetical protein